MSGPEALLEFSRALTFTTFKRRLPKVTNPSWILPPNVLRFLLGNYIFLLSIRDFVSTFRANESFRLIPSSVFFVSMERKICVMLLQQRQEQDFFASPRAGWPLFERGRVNIEFLVSSDIVGLSKLTKWCLGECLWLLEQRIVRNRCQHEGFCSLKWLMVGTSEHIFSCEAICVWVEFE